VSIAASAQDEAPQAEASGEEPTAVVERLHEALIGVMKQAETLGYEGRYAQLEPVLPEVFDLAFMAEKSVGRHWKAASPEDQQTLLATFRRFSIANYAGRFEGYSGQQFETLGLEPSSHGTLLVRTRLVDPEGDDVKLDYRLRESDGRWKIIDVYLNGTVSELALRRSEYSALIKREGFQALLAALDERIDAFATAPADHAS
jgi:phospholipid transport system substrate-binding protein